MLKNHDMCDHGHGVIQYEKSKELAGGARIWNSILSYLNNVDRILIGSLKSNIES